MTACECDINGVLSLQTKYLYKNLTTSALKNGFVTTPFSVGQLKDIINQQGLFVAKNEESIIIGYLFAGSWTYFKQWEIFNFMISRFPSLSFNNAKITTVNSFQYGPVCIEKDYRGQGVLSMIFEAMRLALHHKYPYAITFINQINIVSKRAHIKNLGWEIIDEFAFNNNNYICLAFDMRNSVLN